MVDTIRRAKRITLAELNLEELHAEAGCSKP